MLNILLKNGNLNLGFANGRITNDYDRQRASGRGFESHLRFEFCCRRMLNGCTKYAFNNILSNLNCRQKCKQINKILIQISKKLN